MIRNDSLEKDVSAYIRTKSGPVRFEFDYIPLRVCYLLAAYVTVHGEEVLHYRFISGLSAQEIKQDIDYIAGSLMNPGEYLVVRLRKRNKGEPLDQCELYSISDDGFELEHT